MLCGLLYYNTDCLFFDFKIAADGFKRDIAMKKFALTALSVSMVGLLTLNGCDKQQKSSSDQPQAVQLADCDSGNLRNNLNSAIRQALLSNALLHLSEFDDSQAQYIEEDIRRQFSRMVVDIQSIEATDAGCVAHVNIVSSEQFSGGRNILEQIAYHTINGQVILDNPTHPTFELIAQSVATKASMSASLINIEPIISNPTVTHHAPIDDFEDLDLVPQDSHQESKPKSRPTPQQFTTTTNDLDDSSQTQEQPKKPKLNSSALDAPKKADQNQNSANKPNKQPANNAEGVVNQAKKPTSVMPDEILSPDNKNQITIIERDETY